MGCKESILSLEGAVKTQCANGNWNHDQYMHGMANGMIFALSLFKSGRPKYLEAPKEWGEDMPDNREAIGVSTDLMYKVLHGDVEI